ncbi:hypothetical protein T484DRAFT_1962102 [Baffinella frigidus]|nr:hypothetical protein T484DRAFT_1962102 [Cryptophyta sp. CCMP2293]
MAEDFDPESYLDAQLNSASAASASNQEENGGGGEEKKEERKSSRGDGEKRRRSKSRSRERKRSRSKERRRRSSSRDRGAVVPHRSSGGGGGYGGGGGGGYGGAPAGGRRYDESYKLERDVPDRLPAEQMAKDEDGFDRDMRTLFVAQVARKADERDLFGFFSDVGKVQGHAHEQDACMAAVGKSGEKLCGFPIVIQASQAEKNQAARLAAQAASESDKPTSVEVRNLHVDIGDDEVITAKIERAGGMSTGKGKVEFKTIADAHKAVTHLNGFDLAGQALTVTLIQAAASAPGYGTQIGASTEVLDDNELGGVHVSAQGRQALMQKLARGAGVLPNMPGQYGAPPGPPGMPPPGMPPPPQQYGAPSGYPAAGHVHQPPGMVSTAGPIGVPGAFFPPGQPQPSTFLLLNNMFDPTTESDPNFHLDIQEDVNEECAAKFGRVLSVNADRANPNGLVYVQFETVDSSVIAQKGLQGRFFAGKMISATFLSPTTFSSCLTALPRN